MNSQYQQDEPTNSYVVQDVTVKYMKNVFENNDEHSQVVNGNSNPYMLHLVGQVVSIDQKSERCVIVFSDQTDTAKLNLNKRNEEELENTLSAINYTQFCYVSVTVQPKTFKQQVIYMVTSIFKSGFKEFNNHLLNCILLYDLYRRGNSILSQKKEQSQDNRSTSSVELKISRQIEQKFKTNPNNDDIATRLFEVMEIVQKELQTQTIKQQEFIHYVKTVANANVVQESLKQLFDYGFIHMEDDQITIL